MRYLIAGLALAAIGLHGAQASAEDRTVLKSASKKVYVGVAPGYVMPNDVKFSSTAGAVSGSGKWKLDNGYSLSGFAGYEFNDYLRSEAEISYSRIEYDKVTVNGLGSADVDGKVTSTVGMLSGLVSPLGKTRVRPLVGAGAGWASTDDKIKTIGGVPVDSDHSRNNLALSGTAGMDYEASDSLSFGLRYRYMWIDSSHNGVEDFTAHNITANAAIHF